MTKIWPKQVSADFLADRTESTLDSTLESTSPGQVDPRVDPPCTGRPGRPGLAQNPFLKPDMCFDGPD